MSKPEHVDETRRWLTYAREDLTSAVAMLERGLGVPRQACWLAQQAAEKAMKGVLVFLQIDFPRTHDLDLLCSLLPADWKIRSDKVDLSELSEWSVEARYPGDWPEISLVDARRAASMAQRIIESLLKDLGRQGYPM